MKRIYILFAILLISALSCTDNVKVTEPPISDPADCNMKFIPENPTSADNIKLIVYADCTYNRLSGVSRSGNMINIRKQFNSMMKLACFPQNDTIMIGQLPEGTYTVNYKLIDLSTEVQDSIALSFAFALAVSN